VDAESVKSHPKSKSRQRPKKFDTNTPESVPAPGLRRSEFCRSQGYTCGWRFGRLRLIQLLDLHKSTLAEVHLHIIAQLLLARELLEEVRWDGVVLFGYGLEFLKVLVPMNFALPWEVNRVAV
jgi:hypothetical protein